VGEQRENVERFAKRPASIKQGLNRGRWPAQGRQVQRDRDRGALVTAIGVVTGIGARLAGELIAVSFAVGVLSGVEDYMFHGLSPSR
jgi:hypothetical protein